MGREARTACFNRGTMFIWKDRRKSKGKNVNYNEADIEIIYWMQWGYVAVGRTILNKDILEMLC